MGASNPQAQGLAFGSSLAQTQQTSSPFSGAGTTGVGFGGGAFGTTGAVTPSIGGVTSLGGIGMGGLQQQPGTGHILFQATTNDEKSSTGVPSALMSITAMKEYEGCLLLCSSHIPQHTMFYLVKFSLTTKFASHHNV